MVIFFFKRFSRFTLEVLLQVLCMDPHVSIQVTRLKFTKLNPNSLYKEKTQKVNPTAINICKKFYMFMFVKSSHYKILVG